MKAAQIKSTKETDLIKVGHEDGRLRTFEEQVEEMTCESIQVFINGSRQLLRSLEIVDHDLTLMNYGKRLVFALDFSEIHTFLWPEKSQSHNRQITRTLFLSKDIEFALLPGTTIEFIRHLKRLTYSSDAARRKFEDMVNAPFVSALLRYFDQARPDDAYTIVPNGISRIRADLSELANMSTLLNRLSYLNTMENLYSLDNYLGPDDLSIRPDLNILRQCQMSLDLHRPGDWATNNFIDAHNYALAWSLSNCQVHERDTIYLCVTSSPIPFHVFRNIIWHDFPTHVKNPKFPDLSLVRHPVQVLYLSRVLSLGKEGRKDLKQAINSLRSLLKHLGRNPTYERYIKKKEAPTTLIKLPKNKSYQKAFITFRSKYANLFTSVRSAIESDIIAEENYRREKGISPWALGARASSSLDDARNFASTRIVFSLFDQLNRLTLKSLEKFSLNNIPEDIVTEVDTEGILTHSKRLYFKHAVNNEFGCVEVSAVHEKSEEVFFSGDVYPDYFALWWTVRVTFADFLAEVRRFIALAHETKRKVSFSADRVKAFNGVYIYCLELNKPIVTPLEQIPELATEDVLDMAEGKTVRMIRIANDFGDICYDFEAFSGVPQRAGIISHLRLSKPIAWLIHNTNQKTAPFMEQYRMVSRCINLMKGTRTTNG